LGFLSSFVPGHSSLIPGPNHKPAGKVEAQKRIAAAKLPLKALLYPQAGVL
jgi:hypothetical protein